MPTFRVTTGTHRTADGTRAEAGDVVDIPESVADDFPNKFERVAQDEEDTAESSTDSVDESPPNNPTEPDGDVAAAGEVGSDEEADEDDTESPGGLSDGDVGDAEPAAEIPDDYATLSKMAANFDGDEIHGAMSGDEINNFLETLPKTEVAALKTQAQEELSDGE